MRCANAMTGARFVRAKVYLNVAMCARPSTAATAGKRFISPIRNARPVFAALAAIETLRLFSAAVIYLLVASSPSVPSGCIARARLSSERFSNTSAVARTWVLRFAASINVTNFSRVAIIALAGPG